MSPPAQELAQFLTDVLQTEFVDSILGGLEIGEQVYGRESFNKTAEQLQQDIREELRDAACYLAIGYQTGVFTQGKRGYAMTLFHVLDAAWQLSELLTVLNMKPLSTTAREVLKESQQFLQHKPECKLVVYDQDEHDQCTCGLYPLLDQAWEILGE